MTNDRFKFRAWDKKNNRWVDNYDTIYVNEGSVYIYNTNSYTAFMSRIDAEVMQWTGHKVGGKDVYEYDILLNRDGDRLNYAVVVWISEWAMFAVLNPDEWEGYQDIGWLALDENEPYNTWTEDLGVYELAGNIFEHSNLMEV